MNLSKNFTLETLTRTDVRAMVQKNIDAAANDPKIKASLTRVASELLEPIQALFKKPLSVHSGYRCKDLNSAIGGSATSQHCVGEAADFIIPGYETQEKQIDAIRQIVTKLPKLQFGQLLSEYGCMHISLGTKKEMAYYVVATKTKTPIVL